MPLEAEKAVIDLFGFYLGFDNFYEEWNHLELNKILAKEKAQAAERKTTEDTILRTKLMR